jgi:hypothetical protein
VNKPKPNATAVNVTQTQTADAHRGRRGTLRSRLIVLSFDHLLSRLSPAHVQSSLYVTPRAGCMSVLASGGTASTRARVVAVIDYCSNCLARHPSRLPLSQSASPAAARLTSAAVSSSSAAQQPVDIDVHMMLGAPATRGVVTAPTTCATDIHGGPAMDIALRLGRGAGHDCVGLLLAMGLR